MATLDDVARVKSRIRTIYDRRRLAVYALSLKYAAEALIDFQVRQGANEFWNNQTGQALRRAFSNADLQDNVVTWFLAHGVKYGVYLELANNRAHEALRPIVNRLLTPFLSDLQSIFSG